MKVLAVELEDAVLDSDEPLGGLAGRLGVLWDGIGSSSEEADSDCANRVEEHHI